MSKATIHRQVAELGARTKKSAEDARRWALVKDGPERKKRCQYARELTAYTQALGLDKILRAELEFYLFRYMAATNGAAELESCPNWHMGILISESLLPEEEYARVVSLPARHRIKLRLADRAVAASSVLKLAEEQSGLRLHQRESSAPDGTDGKVTGGWTPTKVLLYFVQDFVEIGRLAGQLRGGSRDENDAYFRAAQSYVDHLKEEVRAANEAKVLHPRAYVAPVPKKPTKAQVKAAARAASRAAASVSVDGSQADTQVVLPGGFQGDAQRSTTRFQSKLHLLTAEVLEDGADPESLAEILEAQAVLLRQKHREAMAGKYIEQAASTGSDASSPVHTALNTVRVKDDSERCSLRLVTSEDSQESAQNGPISEILVGSAPYQVATPLNTPEPLSRHSCPSPDVDAEEINERMAMICEASGVALTPDEENYEDDAGRRADANKQARRDLCEVCHSSSGAPDGTDDVPMERM